LKANVPHPASDKTDWQMGAKCNDRGEVDQIFLRTSIGLLSGVWRITPLSRQFAKTLQSLSESHTFCCFSSI